MKHTIAVMIIIGIIGIFIQTASATQISVEPSHIEVAPGEEFTVNITVDPEGNETFSAQYTLYFDNILLRAQSQNKGPFLGSDTIPVANEIYNHLGKTEYGETRKGNTGVTEPGVLATIDFEVRGNSGTCELRLDEVILSDPSLDRIPTQVYNGMLKIKDSQPSSPFHVYGYVFYENGGECLNPRVNITNLNTSGEWQAETNASYNYYQLILRHGIDIVAGETLQFEVTSPDGSHSNITNYTIAQDDINNGGLFNFNITFEAKPGIFDTEAPDNPYPSIMGVHNGTIIPDLRIEANRIYTYACPGTGGHTEYARIWGNGVDAYANWSGYAGDWHNLTFNTTFTLEPGKEYNYTIRTGSYPQIIHVHSGEEYNATGGKIKCTEFIDANGKKYTGWIPAIRLWREEG